MNETSPAPRMGDSEPPDFSVMQNLLPFDASETILRRHDLAQLRQCYLAAPDGIEDGNVISKASRKRLIAHGMLERRISNQGGARTYVTPYGEDVVRANASCIDGSEGYPR